MIGRDGKRTAGVSRDPEGTNRRCDGSQQVDAMHVGVARALLAGIEHARNGVGRPGEDRFDVTVFAIPHPAGQPKRIRLSLGPSAEPYALYEAADPYLDGALDCHVGRLRRIP